MKSWTPAIVLLAFAVGITAPVAATTHVSAWEVVQSNPGTNCTIGRATLNNDANTAGSTVRSKATCSESASDVNLPADRMGVATSASDSNGNACGSGGYVDNAASTASKSIAVTVYCTGLIYNLGYQRRKINATDWVYNIAAPDPLVF